MTEFLEQLGVCPACHQAFADHSIAMIASFPVKTDSDPRAAAVLEAIKNRDWGVVLAFTDWEGGVDDYELYAIRAASHPVVLVTVWDPVELFFTDRVVKTEILDETASAELLALTTTKTWHSPSTIV